MTRCEVTHLHREFTLTIEGSHDTQREGGKEGHLQVHTLRPTSHREAAEDAFDIRGSCGFSFGNGCSGGTSETNLFGTPRKKSVQTPSEVF